MPQILATARRDAGAHILLIAAAAALAISAFDFFWTGNGIHGTAGAGLVVISSALMVAAAAALILAARMSRPQLEADLLLAAMAAAAVGWIVHLASDRSRRLASDQPIARPGAL